MTFATEHLSPEVHPTTGMNERKLKALKKYLIESGAASLEEIRDETVESTYIENWGTWEIIGNEYKVLTEEEADEATAEEIKNSLWAFTPEFILHHTDFYQYSTDYEDEAFLDALRNLQERICEGADAIIRALILDLDKFIEDAVDADGRGHFISFYDGKENESDDFYIYRIN